MKSTSSELISDLPTSPFPTKAFSFQWPTHQKIPQFLTDYLYLHALTMVGKRVTDSAVVPLNSSQKEMVQTIVDSNLTRTDNKSVYLRERAQKFLKILWKVEKYNHYLPIAEINPKKQKKLPNYASPIHNLRKHKLTQNTSFGSLRNNSGQSKQSQKLTTPRGLGKRGGKQMKRELRSTESSRIATTNSEDLKFEKIKLSPQERKRGDKDGEKSFQVDLTTNITCKTMLITRNYQNMIRMLRHQ